MTPGDRKGGSSWHDGEGAGWRRKPCGHWEKGTAVALGPQNLRVEGAWEPHLHRKPMAFIELVGLFGVASGDLMGLATATKGPERVVA